ncbi:hypothetical protein [Mesobacillus jeotgali]|uniref:hypothetical protein n=1 Tax=Mesobacillus jeotgali TaxID=129985 RepID=UPI001CFD6510|nr:hypothetical protein [Mesobacillus jeotgali]
MDIEHPSITRALLTGYPEQEPIDVCANPDCEKAIFTGDQVWAKGSERYCKLKCLADSFENKEEEING